LEEKVKMVLMWSPHPLTPMQIRKLIVSPEAWDDDIWGDPDDYDEGNNDNHCSHQIPLHMRLDPSLKQNTF